MAFPDGLKFRFLYDAGVEFLAPDMGVQFLHSGDGRDFNSSIVKVGYVAGAAVPKDVNGAEGQPLISGIHFIEDHQWFSLRCALPKKFDVLDHLDSLIVSFEIIIPIPAKFPVTFLLGGKGAVLDSLNGVMTLYQLPSVIGIDLFRQAAPPRRL